MAETGRLVYTTKDFPWAKFRLGRKSWGVGFQFNPSFGKTHANSLIETGPGKYEEYEIQFTTAQAESLAYYVAATTPNKPALYMHLIVYPKWPVKTPSGDELFEFGTKFKQACLEQLEGMSEEDKLALMGSVVMENIKAYLDDVFSWSEYAPKHPRSGQANKNKSQQMKVAVWTQEASTVKDEKKRKFLESEKGRESNFFIPNTDVMMYTKFFIRDEPKHITDYARLKRFLYRRDHPNANEDNTRYTLLVKLRVMAPSLVFNPKKNERGVFQFKASEIKFSGWSPIDHNSMQSEERITRDTMEAQAAADEYGFVHHEEREMEESTTSTTSTTSMGDILNKRVRTNDGTAVQLGVATSPTDDSVDREYDEKMYASMIDEAASYL